MNHVRGRCLRGPVRRPGEAAAHHRAPFRAVRRILPSIVLLLLAACSTPIQVERVGAVEVHRDLTRSVISTGDISPDSTIVLQQRGLLQLFRQNPDRAIAILHRSAVAERLDEDVLFALAEMSFSHAQETGAQSEYLAATVYAFAFLFPPDSGKKPNEFDPRVRIASDIYNRSLTSAFESPETSAVVFHSGRFALPFGSLDINYNQQSAHWGNLILTDFTPAQELRVQGLRSTYRRHGLGAALAAEASSRIVEKGFQVEPNIKVPATAFLRLNLGAHEFASGHISGTIDIYPAFEPGAIDIGGESVPLEVDISAPFAYGLSDPEVWEGEFAGFLNGDYFSQTKEQLVSLEPFRSDQMPIIFIHGTASSPGRWADLINDLQSDPVIREHFQFWSFSYASGSPTAFSALQLRTAIDDALRKLDPDGRYPALQRMVLIGHSQGGLIAKLLVVDSGSRLWDALSREKLDRLHVSDKTRSLLQQTLFVRPVPQVRCVIFIATPQHGSFAAGSTLARLLASLVTPPSRFIETLRDVSEDNPNALKVPPGPFQFGSVSFMTPGSPLSTALAESPISPAVASHSIIAVKGGGPIETGDDGVVTYRSAHIDGVQSELVIRSGHSVQGDPQTVAEVRRILLAHLAEFCGTGCSPKSLNHDQLHMSAAQSAGSRVR